MKSALPLYSIFILSSVLSVHAAEHQCTERDSYAAEVIVDYMDSWKNMHRAYKQFKQCSEDGAAGEGFSDADARLMANHWENMGQLLPMVTTDKGFEKWIIRHIDETDSDDDVRRIDHFAQTACPMKAQDFCAKLHKHISSLPQEYISDEKHLP